MSEVEVVDPVAEGVDKEEKWPPCFGEYDAVYEDCSKICLMRVQCKRHTQQAPKAAPPAPELDPIDELPEMSPHDFLVESLNAKFDVNESVKGNLTVISCRKDGVPVAQIGYTKEGRYLFNTKQAKLELNELESTRQVLNLVNALLA